MGLNKSKIDIRERRRQLVAQFMVRRPRVTQRQLRAALAERGHVNPETGAPWSLGTINRDVEAVREKARARMEDDANTWRARELEMLRELQADAWDAGEYRTVVSISKRRAKLIGLDSPDELRATMDMEGDVIPTLMQALQDFPQARAAAANALAGDAADE